MDVLEHLISVIIIFSILFLIRVLIVTLMTVKGWRKTAKRSANEKVKIAIVLGSGGHTSEMMYLVKSLSASRYSPRLYIMASSDQWSTQPVLEFEESFKYDKNVSSFQIVNIPRSRSVHQSYLTAVFTTLQSTICCIPILLKFRPDIVLCNGPGTCVPICVLAFFLRCCFITNSTIIFIESICRVKSLSLSGKILKWFVDEIYVQWPELKLECKRAKYIGRVM